MPRVKYETDTGDIRYMRLSAKKAAVAGTPPAGTVDDVRFYVTADGSKRGKNTLVARRAVYNRSDAVGTTGRLSFQTVRIPILNKDDVLTVPGSINYNGKTDWELVDVISEG